MKQILEKCINYSAYLNGTQFLGTVDVTLPTFDALTQTVSGAGIAGEFESPTVGHFGSQTATLNWRTIESATVSLLAPNTHAIDFRGAFQVTDTSSGATSSVGRRVTIRGRSKSAALGNLAPNASTESSNEIEVTYIKIFIDGKAVLEYDKMNSIFIVDGVDYLAAMRSQLGM